jgi:anti-anti-sigma factor
VPQPDEGVFDLDIRDDVVWVRGDLDMDTAAEFTSTLGTIEGTLVLDLEGVTFLDSTGLQCLVRLRDVLLDRGEKLVLRSPSPAVCRVFDLTNMWEAFAVER